MAVLKAAARKKIPAGKFGLPGRRAYPMPDKSHAGNAKARAAQQVGKSITSAQKAEIDAKANKVLASKGSQPAKTSLLASKGRK